MSASASASLELLTGADDAPPPATSDPHSFARHAAWLSLKAAAVIPASGPTVLDLGGPQQGRFWEVTGFAVVGADDHTQVASTSAALYIGSVMPNGAPALGDVVLPGSINGAAQTVPRSQTFSRRQLLALAPAHVYVVVTGGAAGTNLTAVLLGWDRDVEELPNK